MPAAFQAAPPASLRFSGFPRFWAARTLSTLAFQVTAVAVGWQVYALTDSTFELGLIGLAQFVPMLLLTLPAGHVADRYDRRTVARTCQTTEALAVAALAAGGITGHLGVGGVFAAVAVVGGSRGFESPAVAALLPGVVSAEALPRALALSASANQTATIVGPALGGLLYGLGPAAAYATAAAFWLAASLLVGSLRVTRPTAKREPAGLTTLLSGFTYIRDHPAILGAVSLDLFAVLLGGATALLPVYARDILHTGPVGLGALRAAPAAGALLTSVVLARRPLGGHVGVTMLAAVGVFGLATVLFGLSRSIPLSLAALAIMGASDVVSVVIRGALVQLQTPDAMRGRVSAVNFLFIGTSNQLGEFESGVTASLLGTVPAVVVGGCLTLLVAATWWHLFPTLRRADRLDPASA